MARSAARRRVIFICLLPFLFGAATSAGHAQNRKPTAKEITAIRNCAKKYDTSDLNEVERKCPFNLVGAPCMERPEGQSNVGVADCYRLEGAIWYDLLNENYSLAADLDDEQKAKLRDMQRAWIAYREWLLLRQDPRNDGGVDDGGLRRPGDGEASRAAAVFEQLVVWLDDWGVDLF